jgi:hypothetical protein
LDIHRRMAEMEALLTQSTEPSPFAQLVNDLSPTERKVVQDYFARLRAVMLDGLRDAGIPLDVHRTSARWVVQCGMTGIDIAVAEVSPNRLRGYGAVDPAAATQVATLQQALLRLAQRVAAHLRQGLGHDLSQRLARLEASRGDVGALAALERVVTRWGLVEFRPQLDLIVRRLEAPEFESAVFGRVSSGKSSLLNHVIGRDVLPVGVTPITAVPTRLVRGDRPAALISFAEEAPRTVPGEELGLYASEEGNPGNRRRVTGMLVLPFSTRSETARWLHRLREAVLLPVARDVAGERRAALRLKLATLARSCDGYLTVGLRAAERADAERERLRAAVLNESVRAEVIRDELRLAARRVCEETRPAFEKAFFGHRAVIVQRTAGALAAELRAWQGNLARQAERYEAWMAGRLDAELAPLSRGGAVVAADLVGQAEARLRRVIEAFRDRLSRNIAEATGVTVSSAAWEVKRQEVAVVPVAVSRAFMTDWGLLWWLLPMGLVGGLFRRHVLGRVPWEVEKNLNRLAGDWAGALEAAVSDLRAQAAAWVDAELATLDRLLKQRPAEASAFREALRQLAEMGVAPPGSGNGRGRVQQGLPS